jgi:hypothetical protein
MAINSGPADSTNVEQFWKNILDDPVPQNAMNDNNGTRWQNAQGGNVLYFPGNDAQNHTRVITQSVPSNKRLCIAVNPVIITDHEAGSNTGLAGLAQKDENSASKANLTINGQRFDLIALNYRCANGGFQIRAPPAGTLWGIPNGPHDAAADGYYTIIEPLDPGDYTMEIDAQVDDPFPFNQPPVAWTSKVTYNFKVVGP